MRGLKGRICASTELRLTLNRRVALAFGLGRTIGSWGLILGSVRGVMQQEHMTLRGCRYGSRYGAA